MLQDNLSKKVSESKNASAAMDEFNTWAKRADRMACNVMLVAFGLFSLVYAVVLAAIR